MKQLPQIKRFQKNNSQAIQDVDFDADVELVSLLHYITWIVNITLLTIGSSALNGLLRL